MGVSPKVKDRFQNPIFISVLLLLVLLLCLLFVYISHVMIYNNNLAIHQLVLTNWTTLEISVSL